MTTNILQMTAEHIAAAARRTYLERPVEVIDAVTTPMWGVLEAIVTIGGKERFYVAIQVVEEGVSGHNYEDDNRLLAEWSHPQFAERVAAGITALGQPYGFDPFPITWMEVDL